MYTTGAPLRFYTKPAKILLYLLLALVFDIIGIAVIVSSRDSGSAILGWFVLGFFGLGALVFLMMLVQSRKPLMAIDAQGWSCRKNLFGSIQCIQWQDIGGIAIHRQRTSAFNTMYYLVLHARYPEKLPRSRMRSFNASFYSSLQNAIISMPLNQLFVHSSSEESLRLLDQIVAAYGAELQRYGIRVQRTIYPL